MSVEFTARCPNCGTDAIWSNDLERVGELRTTMYAGASPGQDMRPQIVTTTIHCPKDTSCVAL